VRAGTLRDRILLERPAAPEAGSWGLTPDHEPVPGGSVWASVLATAADEKDGPRGTRTVTRYTVRIRYRPDVNNKWRIAFRGKTLDIVSVTDPDGRRRELEIEAVAHG
jgi:SPP1 family predicted phage head-tail adaptor